MPLDFSVKDIDNFEEVTTCPWSVHNADLDWNIVTSRLVMYSMVCGYNSITKENYKDVAKRVMLMQRVYDEPIRYRGTKYFLNEHDVKLHIGLTTNASTFNMRDFYAKLGNYVSREPTEEEYSAHYLLNKRAQEEINDGSTDNPVSKRPDPSGSVWLGS